MQSLTVVFFDKGQKVSRTFSSGKCLMTPTAAAVEFSEGCTAVVYVDGERVATESTNEGLFVVLYEHGAELVNDLVKRES